MKRAMLALLDGVTAGALVQAVPRPITAYSALFAVALFLVGVFLLPCRERGEITSDFGGLVPDPRSARSLRPR